VRKCQHFLIKAAAHFLNLNFQIKMILKIHPKLGRCTKKTGKPQGGYLEGYGVHSAQPPHQEATTSAWPFSE